MNGSTVTIAKLFRVDNFRPRLSPSLREQPHAVRALVSEAGLSLKCETNHGVLRDKLASLSPGWYDEGRPTERGSQWKRPTNLRCSKSN